MKAKILIATYKNGGVPIPIRVYMENYFTQAEKDLEMLMVFGDSDKDFGLVDTEVYGTE
jgi:hypothetical protein